MTTTPSDSQFLLELEEQRQRLGLRDLDEVRIYNSGLAAGRAENDTPCPAPGSTEAFDAIVRDYGAETLYEQGVEAGVLRMQARAYAAEQKLAALVDENTRLRQERDRYRAQALGLPEPDQD